MPAAACRSGHVTLHSPRWPLCCLEHAENTQWTKFSWEAHVRCKSLGTSWYWTWGEKGPPRFSLSLVAVRWSVLSKVLRRKIQQTPNLELHAHWPQKWHFVQQQGQTFPAPCCKGLGWTPFRLIKHWRLRKQFRSNWGGRNLTYHVPLLVDHHPKVFKDVVDVYNVRLHQATTETDWLWVCFLGVHRAVLDWLTVVRTSSCLMADSLSWICCRSSSVMTSAWDWTWESLQEWDKRKLCEMMQYLLGMLTINRINQHRI